MQTTDSYDLSGAHRAGIALDGRCEMCGQRKGAACPPEPAPIASPEPQPTAEDIWRWANH